MFYCLSVHFLFIENFASIFVYCCPVLQTKSYYAVKYRILYVNELITKLLLFLYLNFKTPNLSGKHTHITICTMKNYIITIMCLANWCGRSCFSPSHYLQQNVSICLLTFFPCHEKLSNIISHCLPLSLFPLIFSSCYNITKFYLSEKVIKHDDSLFLIRRWGGARSPVLSFGLHPLHIRTNYM